MDISLFSPQPQVGFLCKTFPLNNQWHNLSSLPSVSLAIQLEDPFRAYDSMFPPTFHQLYSPHIIGRSVFHLYFINKIKFEDIFIFKYLIYYEIQQIFYHLFKDFYNHLSTFLGTPTNNI